MNIPSESVERRIAQWLRAYLAKLLALNEAAIDEKTSFGRYGLDSSAAVAMAGDLGDWLGCEIDPVAAYDYPSVRELARALSSNAGVCAALYAREHGESISQGVRHGS